jgi:hypothetical protein
MRVSLLLALLVAGCHFGVSGVDEGMPGDDGGSPADLTGPGGDDLTNVPPDLVDPCGSPPTPVSGAIVASCVIGSPPVIDGDLSDWPTSLFTNSVRHATADYTSGQFSGNETNNDADISGAFAVRWDADNLYIAATITDDQRSVTSTTYYDDDAIEILIDGFGDRDPPYEADDAQLVFVANGGAGQMWKFGVFSGYEPLPNGVKSMARDTGTTANWTFEAAIPWTALTLNGASTGHVLGFDVSLDDSDPGSAMKYLVWKNKPPAGCMCNGTSCLPYCTPQSFASLQLGSR